MAWIFWIKAISSGGLKGINKGHPAFFCQNNPVLPKFFHMETPQAILILQAILPSLNCPFHEIYDIAYSFKNK